MSVKEKIKHELKAVILVTLYFAAWLGAFMGLKVLILEDYQIRFGSVSAVLFGALILAKVVLILEHVPLGGWLRKQPVLVDVIVRTLLYAFGTLIVILLENAFESRHEQGGFGPALVNVLQHRDMPHVWANTICVLGALLFCNLLSALSHHPRRAFDRSVLVVPSHCRARSFAKERMIFLGEMAHVPEAP